MKNKNILNPILVSAALLLLVPAGCSDFLEKPLQGQLTQQNFPTSAADALGATNGAYSILRNANYHFGLFPIMDIMSDDAYKGSNPTDQAATIGPYNNFTHISTELTMASWWSTLYQGVKTANVVIEKLPFIKIDEALKTRYIAEASFLRALHYFDLARAWGGVPLVTTTVVPPSLARSPIGDIYDLIIGDLQIAIAGLPEKSDYAAKDAGRATKGAAKALLAKVFLFFPQPDKLNYVPQPDFTNAAKYALEVINSGQYSVESYFANANGVPGENGVESIFEIGALPFEGQENGGNQYANVQGVRGNPNRGWGFNRPSLNLMAAYESQDPRQDKSIITLGEVIDGVTIEGDGNTPEVAKTASNNTIEIECYNQKEWTPGVNVPTQFEHHRRILCYADVLLIAAEALNEIGNDAEARMYLNRVRLRARGGNGAILPDVTETNKALLRDLILKERRIELALEGHRFWDLVRTGKASAVLGPLGFTAGKHELLAIPQTEIDLSHNVLTQNPGWNE